MIMATVAGDISPLLERAVRYQRSQPGMTCNDTREDDHRDAVTDTALGDLLTQPHQEHRACDERNTLP